MMPRQWPGSDLRTWGTSRLLRDAHSQETEKASLEIVSVQGERKNSTQDKGQVSGLSSETVAEGGATMSALIIHQAGP